MKIAQKSFCFFFISIIGVFSFIPAQKADLSDTFFEESHEGIERLFSIAEVVNLSESHVALRKLPSFSSIVTSQTSFAFFRKVFITKSFSLVNAFQRNVFYINTFIHAP